MSFDKNGCVVALGFFDGVHMGHRALFEKTVERARELGVEPAVVSFDVHPDNMVKGGNVPLINTPVERTELLRRLFGIERQIVLHFDERLMKMPWDEFIVWLSDRFGAKHLVCGYDFRFGHRGQGNSERLREKCAELSIGSDVIPQVTMDGVVISSTYIRGLLQEGRMAEANRFLGHCHTMTDHVRCGYRLGTKLGLPTINMRVGENVLVPAHGVYAAKAHVEGGGEYIAVTNVGVRPTVGGVSDVSVESHLLDFSGNLYGRSVRLDFYEFIRPERKFNGTEELKAEILANIKTVREYFEKNS